MVSRILLSIDTGVWLVKGFQLIVLFLFLRIQYLFKPKPGEHHPDHFSYRALFPKIIQDIEVRNILSYNIIFYVFF